MDEISMDQLQYETYSRHITEYPIRECSICGAKLKYHVTYTSLACAEIFFDGNCYCSSIRTPMHKISWDEFLRTFNRQTPEVRDRMWNEFLALSPRKHTLTELVGELNSSSSPEVQLAEHTKQQEKQRTSLVKGFEQFQHLIRPANVTEDTMRMLELCWYTSAGFIFETVMQLITNKDTPSDSDFETMQNLIQELTKSQVLAVEHIAKYHPTSLSDS